MKRLAVVFTAIFVFITGCAGIGSVKAPDAVYELVVLHTNDHHGALTPEVKDLHDIPLKDGAIGGVAERATLIRQVRDTGANVMLLDAGDLFVTQNMLSAYFNGELDVKIYNWLGYDAIAFGNNEFQNGMDTLRRLMAMADFPFLGANVKLADGSWLGEPWIIREYDGLKIGVFGILTTSTIEISADDGVILTDEIQAAKDAVAYLRGKEKCDVVIALTHVGMKESGGYVSSQVLAREVADIDLIIDGHSHTFVEEPAVINGTPIVSTGQWGRYVGEAIITATGGNIIIDWRVIPVRGFEPDPATVAFLAPFIDEADAHFKAMIGIASAEFPFVPRQVIQGETAIGNMVNDATMWYIRNILKADVDFAYTNAGTIRAGLAAGDINLLALHDVLPFNNNIMLVTMDGAALKKFFAHTAAFPQGHRGWGQVSAEARYTVDFSGDKGVLRDLTINGKPVEDGRIYTFAATDFITGGGNGHTIQEDSISMLNTGVNFRDAVAEYIKAAGTVTPITDGRIKIIK